MKRFILLIALVGLGAAPMAAQYTTASLGGSVKDATGAVVPDAQVKLHSEDTGLTRTSTTQSDGTFLFPALPVGRYELVVTKSGFTAYVQTGIILTVNQAATQTVQLQVGAATQKVTVTANAGMLTTRSATVTQLVDQKRIVDLPLNGRTANSLVFLAPGTINTTNNYCGYNCQGGVYPSEQEASVNGGGTANVNYQMDGVDHNDTYVNMNLPFPNPDAIQEFSLQSNNMSAEYGNAANVVNIVTKSGTNQFHGDAFEFLRNGDLNARNFFAPIQDTLKRNQFGGAVGGPIKKDQLFFFGTFQATRIVSAAAGNVMIVPTASQRNGDFGSLCSAYNANGVCESGAGTQLKDPVTGSPFAYNQIPQTRLSTPALNLLKQIPLPNGPNGSITFLGPTLVENENQFMPKIDWIRGRNQLSGRYFYTNYSEPPDLAISKQNLLAMDSSGNQVRVQTLSLNDNYTVSPTLLLNTWFGWDSQVGGSLTGATANFADYGVAIASPQIPQMPTLAVSGFFSAASGHFGGFNRGDKTFREVVTWQKGSHELIFGGAITRINQNISNTNTQGGEFSFSDDYSGSNLADFMVGQVSSFIQGGGQYQNYVGGIYNLFVQDNWRVNQKLTLNFGLRWDPFWPYTETKDRINCYVQGQKSQRYPNAPVGMIFGGDPGCPAGWGKFSNLANFAPRLGFAYRFGGNTVLRGGAGIYYSMEQSSQQNGIAAAAPFAPRFTLTDVSLQDPYGSAGVANPFPADFGGVVPGPSATFTLPITINGTYDRNFHLPTTATWNLSVDRQFGQNWLLSVAYVGNAGYRLESNQQSVLEANPAVYIPGNSTEANTQERRINPNFGPVDMYTSSYNSNYHALQLNFQRRFSRGISILANYTWSHQRGNFGPNNSMQTDSFDRNFDWGNANDNIPNIFHLSEVWQVPHSNLNGLMGKLLNGWEATSIVTWQNGFPFTLYSGKDNSFSDIGADRPDFVGTSLSQAVYRGQTHSQMISKYFNTALFVPNAVGTFGDLGKNTFRGPGFFDTDLGLIKDTKLTEKTTLQFRAEFFNVFNNVNFDNPGGTLGTGTFGKITGAGDPRILQFALKVLF